MKILCVIDHFGSGGAQRQLVELACALKERQHAVETFIYYPEYDFFRNRIAENDIPVHEYSKPAGSSIGLLRRLCQVISAGQYHVVLSYLNTPNLYAELSMMISRSTRLVVSERNSWRDDRSRIHAALYRNMHVLAKRIVVNSFAHKQWLEDRHPWLRKKVECIYNGFRVDQFNQTPLPLDDKRELRLLSVGRIAPQKNVIRLIEACGLFHRQHGWSPFVTWVGRRGDTQALRNYSAAAERKLDKYPEVKNRWFWAGERDDVPELLAKNHALILPSFYEGLPNVVCEALASARPVLLSDVCDNARLVIPGERGFTFDPDSAQDIAESIGTLASLTHGDWIQFGLNARRYAEENLSIDRMVGRYESLFSKIIT